MRLTIGMPYCELTPTGNDNPKSIQRLAKHLTMSVTKYVNASDTEDHDCCLLESNGLTHRFRTGLLDRVRMMANTIGLNIESEVDERHQPTSVFPVNGKEVVLRNYQQVAMDRMMKRPVGVLCAATGAGKTYMAAYMIAQRGVDTLFLVHTKDLLNQAKEAFENILGEKVGVIGDGKYDVQRITVATMQTLSKRINTGELGDLGRRFGMIIVDEVHHVPASTFFAVSGAFSAYFVYGLSATPDRKDGADMMIEAAAGPIIAEIETDSLMKSEDLCRVVARFIDIPAQTSYSPAPRFAVVSKYIVNNLQRNQTIARLVKEFAERNETVLVLVNQVKHANNLKELMPEAEIVQGSDKSVTRQNVWDKLRSKEIRVVISTVAKEGIDVPSLDCVANAFGGTDNRQVIGRVLRNSKGKKMATFLDFVDWGHIRTLQNSRARMKQAKASKEFVVVNA